MAVIDADTGQSSIGPPTTISLGITEREVYSLQDIPLKDAYFIGLTSPAGLFQRSVAAATYLFNLAKSEKCDIILVDTTGWVTGDGVELKISKIHALNPDLIVCIQKNNELEQLIRYLKKFYWLINLKPPEAVKIRSREKRTNIRNLNYKRWFKNPHTITLNLKETPVLYSNLAGIEDETIREELNKNLGFKAYKVIRNNERVIVVVDQEPDINIKDNIKKTLGIDPTYIERKDLIHILVSFRSKKRMFEGLGIITDFQPENMTIDILTPVTKENIEAIEMGRIKLNPETYREEGWYKKRLI